MDPMQQENNELKGRLHAFAAILRLGRDAFAAKDLTAVGVHIVNNSKTLLAYERSVLVDLRGGPHLLAEYAQTEINQHTAYAQSVRQLCRELKIGETPLEIQAENPPEKLSAKGRSAWQELTSGGRRLLAVPLRTGSSPVSRNEPFVWILEYRGEIPPHVPPTLQLLAADFGAALWMHTPRKSWSIWLRWLRK